MGYLKGGIAKAVVTAALACAYSLHPTSLLASTVDWTIAAGATMAGGAGVSGTFDYDATTNTYSDVDIVVGDDFSSPDTVPGDTYITSDIVGDSYDQELDLFDATANTGFQLYFESALSDAGGVVPTGLHLLVGDETVDLEYPGYISFNSSVSSTPEPKTILLMLAGILALAGFRNRSSPGFRGVPQVCRLKAGENQ